MTQVKPYSASAWSEVETWPRERLVRLQLEKLREQLARVGRDNAYYRRRFAECGFDPRGLDSVDDLRALPLTRKEDYAASIAAQPPWGEFVAVPQAQVRRLQRAEASVVAGAIA